jgi:dTDP-4-dehydrorhamnose reductase
MPPPLVSCIVPTFDGEEFLGSALDSIFAQTYPNLEVLVVDDGSTDGTADLVASYGRDVRYLRQPNAGPAAACNHGLGQSRGGFLAFLEQDDLWHPEKLEIQMKALEDRALDYCVTLIENFLEAASGSPATHRIPASRSGPLPGYVTQTLLVRLAAIRRAGAFDTHRRFSHGTEWFLRARARGLVGELIPQVLVRRRIHGANLSLLRADASRDEYLHLLKRSVDDRRGGCPDPGDPDHEVGGENLARQGDTSRRRQPVPGLAGADNVDETDQTSPSRTLAGCHEQDLVGSLRPPGRAPVSRGPGAVSHFERAQVGDRHPGMKVLVTGARGQLGSELVRQALQRGWLVVPLARPDLDIGDGDAVSRAIETAKPSAVLNAAAFTRVDDAEREPALAMRVNAEGVRTLARACRQEQIPIVHFSTDYVFDGRSTRPYRPHDPPSPLGTYGRSKWEGERAILEEADRHLILRTAWVFGVQGHNFVKSILRLTREGAPLRVVDDQVGSPTAADDLANAALTALEHARDTGSGWGLHHFVNAGQTTWHGFAERIVARARGPILARQIERISTTDLRLPAPRPAYSVLDTTTFTETFGLEPRPWEDALDDVLERLDEASIAIAHG